MKKGLMVILLLAAVGSVVWYFALASDEERAFVTDKGKSVGYDAKFHLGQAANSVGSLTTPSGGVEEAQACRAQIRQIESGKRAAAASLGLTYGSEVPIAELCREMGLEELPRCPAGGKYRVMEVGKVVRCSIGVNRTDDLNDDHIVKDF